MPNNLWYFLLAFVVFFSVNNFVVFWIFVEFLLILRNGCLEFWGFFLLGRGFGSWEATASKVCEFDWVLLRW